MNEIICALPFVLTIIVVLISIIARHKLKIKTEWLKKLNAIYLLLYDLKYIEALRELDELSKGENYAEGAVYELRGFIYYQQGQIFQAICNLSKATEVNPKSINSSFIYYLFLVEDGQEDKAREEKQRLCQLLSISDYPTFEKINKEENHAHSL